MWLFVECRYYGLLVQWHGPCLQQLGHMCYPYMKSQRDQVLMYVIDASCALCVPPSLPQYIRSVIGVMYPGHTTDVHAVGQPVVRVHCKDICTIECSTHVRADMSNLVDTACLPMAASYRDCV